MRATLAIIFMFASLALTPLAGAQEEPLQAPRPLETPNTLEADDSSPQGLLSPAETPAAALTSEIPQVGPSTFDLPPLEAMEWRAIDAEIRAIRAEAQQAISERASQQKDLLKEWERRFKIVAWEDWQIDFHAAKLRQQKREVPVDR